MHLMILNKYWHFVTLNSSTDKKQDCFELCFSAMDGKTRMATKVLRSTVDGTNPALPGMYKTPVNNGIFTTVPSTGELAGFLNHRQVLSASFNIPIPSMYGIYTYIKVIKTAHARAHFLHAILSQNGYVIESVHVLYFMQRKLYYRWILF